MAWELEDGGRIQGIINTTILIQYQTFPGQKSGSWVGEVLLYSMVFSLGTPAQIATPLC